MYPSMQADPSWDTTSISSAASCPINPPILFPPSPHFPLEALSLQNITALCVCILSCSSAEYHFDVYFTAVAENRWIVGYTEQCQSECKCAGAYECVRVCGSAFSPACFHWFRRELNSVYVNEVAFKHMPRTIILKQVFSCKKKKPSSERVEYLATNTKPSWGDRGEMSQLVCHLACQFAHGCKHHTEESLCTFNDDHNNKWYRLSIKELPGGDQAGNIVLTFMKFDKCQKERD